MPAPKAPSSAGSKSSPARKSPPAATTAKRSSTNSKSTAASARSGVKATAKTARSAAKGTATVARGGAKRTATTAKSAATKTRRAGNSNSADGVAAFAEQLASRAIKPRDLVMLTRERIQETLDEAAARGRVTRKDANELVAELVRRGRSQTDELAGDVETVLERGREQLESATKRARKTEPIDRLVRGADRARRAAGVGPSFPILGYDALNVGQVQERLKDLRKPELRKVRNYEAKHANRKTIMTAIDKSLA
jgi:polyhydroxyalkanoate synthesis regulator phasin